MSNYPSLAPSSSLRFAGSPLPSTSSAKEDIDVLLIGAAQAPPGYDNDKQFRMFNSVKNDLETMYKQCYDAKFRKGRRDTCFNIRRCIVNHAELVPSSLAQWMRLRGTEYSGEVYQTVDAVRQCVRSFVEDQPGPNLLIYFSGHGDAPVPSGAASRTESVGHLCIPVTTFRTDRKGRSQATSSIEPYLARDFTQDVQDAMENRAGGPGLTCDAKVYLVIDACHAEGAFTMWRLAPQIRLTNFIVLLAGAETQLSTEYDHKGGKFTEAFVRHINPGIKLSDLAQAILTALYDPGKTSPCVKYSHPSLCDRRFLQPTH